MNGYRDAKKKRRGERIFQAALELFGIKGFSATTMKEISRRAELAVGTLYNYYPSKNALLLGIMEKKLEEITVNNRRAIFEIVRNEDDPKIITEKVIRRVVESLFILSKRNWYEVFRALFSVEQDLERGISLDIEGVRMTEGLVRLMQKRGLIKSRFSAHSIAFNLYSVIGFQFMSYVFFAEMTEEQLLEGISEQLELVFEGISRNAGSAPTAD